jgi:SAM-dependent methyltransferase
MLCNICRSDSLAPRGQIQGYRQGSSFTVLECPACDTSVVHPCESDDKLYDAIYKNVARVPGYSRYHALANELCHARDPLAYIASAEDCYYAIVKTLSERVPDKSKAKICEVGCGQGYLTYALVKSGFDCTGIDISADAVGLATQRFGAHYFCGTVSDFCRLNAKPDIVVATELIEHLENPVLFVLTLLSALEERGIIVLTTPNKLPLSHRIWDTELPPVHLWWFTKTGLAAIAQQVNCGISFVDFTEFYDANPQYLLLDQQTNPERTPVFNQGYELIKCEPIDQRSGALKRRIRRLVPKSLVRKFQRLRAGTAFGGIISNANSRTIGAILTRQHS